MRGNLHGWVLILLLGPAAQAQEDQDAPLAVLEHHVTLAREGKAYLQFTRSGVSVFMRGLEVKRIPAREVEGGDALEGKLARVQETVPITPVPQVVVEADKLEVDPAGTVSTRDEIVSVGDMPGTYLARLDDGVSMLVTSELPAGFLNRLRRLGFEAKVRFRCWKSNWQGDSCRLSALEMDGEQAQHLFWLLEPGMGIIY